MKHLQLLFSTIFLIFGTANAAIIHTDLMPDSIVNMTIDPTFGTGSGSNLSPLDINNDGTVDFDIRYNVSPGFGWFLHLVEKNGNQIDITSFNSTTISNPYTVVLNSNDFIGASSNWSSGVEPLIGDTTDYNFGGQGDKFVGIKLLLAGNEHFGWIKVSFDNTSDPKQLLIKEYAFEDVAGVPIAAGQTSGPPPVPEIILTQDDILFNTFDTLDFGSVPTATTSDKFFKVKNIGTTNLKVNNFLISTGNTADFLVTPPSDSIISPGDSINFKVSFSPNITALRTSKLTFDTNDGDEATFSITLNGEGGTGGGGGATGSIVIKHNGSVVANGTGSVDFGEVSVGMDTTLNLVICNTDALNDVTIDFIDVGGFGGGSIFSTSVTTPLTILAGDSFIMPVTFTPTFSGVENSSASFFNFSGTVSYDIQLTGEGIGGSAAPILNLAHNGSPLSNGSSFSFGNVGLGSTLTKDFVLTVSGATSPLSIDYFDVFSFTIGTEFSSTTSFPFTVGVGDSVIIPISYTPSALGLQNGGAGFYPDFSSGIPEFTIQLSGTGVNAVSIQSLDAYGQGNQTEISTPAGTLQMMVDILPLAATNQNVDWTVDNSSIATISSTGVLQAISNGTVTVTATATDGSGLSDSEEIEVKNQSTGITQINKNQFVIYPNPSSNYIEINDLEIKDYIIISSVGKKVESTFLRTNKIFIGELANGVYHLVIKEGNKTKVSKFTKN